MALPEITPDWSSKGSCWFDLWDHTARDDLYANLKLPSPGTAISDDCAMFLAAAIALRGVGRVSPNPLVGSVIVDRNGQFLAAGAHLEIGSNHAEANALAAVSDHSRLEGGTIFVTLEPCAHVGRTPSCAQAIAKTEISRVVYAVRDPNPLVDGAGHKILQQAGKVVEVASAWQSRCEWLTRVFLFNQRHQQVFTALKVASTPDGVIAGDGTSRLWITGERARHFGHFLRLEYDAILIGIETLRLDNPTLNVRHPSIHGRTPLRVILDPRGEIGAGAAKFKMLIDEPDKTMVVRPGRSELLQKLEAGYHDLSLPVDKKGHFDFEVIKKHLWNFGVRSLLIEGGAGVYQTALSSSAVDVIHWFIGDKVVKHGLKWTIPDKLKGLWASGAGISLGPDRFIEISLAER